MSLVHNVEMKHRTNKNKFQNAFKRIIGDTLLTLVIYNSYTT